MFTNNSVSDEYSGIYFGISSSNPSEQHRNRRENVDRSIRILESIQGRLDLYPEPPSTDATSQIPARQRDGKKVFIVHGHDEGPREAVRSFLLRLGFEAIVLHDQPNKGRTIITKFREEAGDAGFAVVLMTPDDQGKAKDATDLKPRARQNVVFELGFFIGELGPERVAALVKGGVERPSDFDGVVYIDIDDGGAWKMMLARELRAAGLSFDANKVFG
jgi:predicted nucleotide-binding protein